MGDFITKKCAVCGKTMVRIYWKDYAYKYFDKFYCTYKCFRVDEKKRLAKNESYINQ